MPRLKAVCDSVIMDTPIPRIILKIDTNNDEGIQVICAKASL